MLEEYIARFVLHMSQNYRKYIGGFFGFFIGVLWLQFGFFPMLFVCLCSILGYKLPPSHRRWLVFSPFAMCLDRTVSERHLVSGDVHLLQHRGTHKR